MPGLFLHPLGLPLDVLLVGDVPEVVGQGRRAGLVHYCSFFYISLI